MVRKTLDELGIEHNTDKATKYPHGGSVHGYTTIYDSILTPLRDEPIRLLEIGICMEGSSGGHSVRMWRDYFSKASLYTFDIVDMSKVISDVEFEGRAHFFQGDQGNRESMSAMYEAFGTKPFDVLLEDGSHTHEHQMISLGHLFKYVKSEGYYLLEDISIPNHPVCCIRNDETYRVLQNYKNTGKFENPHLSPEECKYLENNIKSIELIPDIQDAYCVAVIIKK
jgi:cephalosporin hydroxylase